MIQFESTGAMSSGVWTQPAASIALVKSLHMVNYDTTAHILQMTVKAVGMANGFLMQSVSVPPSTHQEWNGWFVLNPGDTMYLHADGPGLVGWVSGAILMGDPPFPAVK